MGATRPQTSNSVVCASRANASSVRAGRTKTAGVAGGADTSSTVVSIGVDSGVDSVAYTAVRSVSAGGVVISGHMAATGCAGVTSAAETRCASVGAGVGAGRANTSGVACGADTSCAVSAVSASSASGRAVRGVSFPVSTVTERKEAYLARPSRSESMRGSAALAGRLE